MIHQFKNSHVIGKEGEDILMATYDELRFAGGIDCDLIRYPTCGVEVKTDTYPMSKTDNFFMERHGNIEAHTDGGPWYAQLHGAQVFLYFFIQDNRLFSFDNIPALVKRLENLRLTGQLEWSVVRNRSKSGGEYLTGGYKTNRLLLKDLYKEFNLGDPLPF
jgi:hypothetical protein